MHRRWYDHDPTLSMALSLLQNASKQHQSLTVRVMMRYMEQMGLLEEYGLSPEKISFLFPLMRRANLNPSARELIEVIKRLPHNKQLEVALMMIDYIYMLETGSAQGLDEDEPTAGSLESFIEAEISQASLRSGKTSGKERLG